MVFISFIDNGTDLRILKSLNTPMAEELIKAMNPNLVEKQVVVHSKHGSYMATRKVNPNKDNKPTTVRGSFKELANFRDRFVNPSKEPTRVSKPEVRVSIQTQPKSPSKEPIQVDTKVSTTPSPDNTPNTTRQFSEYIPNLQFEPEENTDHIYNETWLDEELREKLKQFIGITTKKGHTITYVINQHLEKNKDKRNFLDPKLIEAAIQILSTSTVTTFGWSPSGSIVYWGEAEIDGVVKPYHVVVQDLFGTAKDKSGLLTIYELTNDPKQDRKLKEWEHYKQTGKFTTDYMNYIYKKYDKYKFEWEFERELYLKRKGEKK